MNHPATDDTAPASPTGSAFDARAFRNALGQFPTGVCVVTARAADGEDLGMTISSFNSLSLDPPLVLFSIDRRSHSLDKWQEAGGYAINILAESQKDVSGRFARPLGNKWTGIDFDRGHADAPLLRGAIACFECSRFAGHDGGDHVLFIVRVVRFRTFTDRSPLIFCKGNYGALKPTGEPAPIWPLAIHY